MSALTEARQRQQLLRRSTEARIEKDRAELHGETARSRPEETLRTRIAERERFLELVETGEWPGISPRHRAALQSTSKGGGESAGDDRKSESGVTPRPPRPKAQEEASGRLSGGESDTDEAVRLILEAGKPREPVPADPDVERAADFILQADRKGDDVDDAVEMILSAGQP